MDHLRKRSKTIFSFWFAKALVGFVFLASLPLCSLVIASEPLSAKNVTLVCHIDIDGGGMVDVEGNLAAIGHMGPPYATSLVDVTDPARPRLISHIKARAGTHSHKARICGTTLVMNVEQYGGGGDGRAGQGLHSTISSIPLYRKRFFFTAWEGYQREAQVFIVSNLTVHGSLSMRVEALTGSRAILR